MSLLTDLIYINVKPCGTPLETKYIRFNHEDNILSSNTLYMRVINKLLCLVITCRPDISVAVRILSRRNEKPKVKHSKTSFKTFEDYQKLSSTINRKINPKLEVCADADMKDDSVTRKSISVNIYFLCL